MWIPSALDKKLRAAVVRAAESAIATRDPVPASQVNALNDALTRRLATLPADPLEALRVEITDTRAAANALVADAIRLTAELVALRKLATEARAEAKAAAQAGADAAERADGLATRLAALTPKDS